MKQMILASGMLGMLLFTGSIGTAQEQAAADSNAAPEEETTAEEACFSIAQAHDMGALHDRFIYLESRGESFLLTMANVCPGLAGNRGIALPPRSPDRVCSKEGYAIGYRRYGSTRPETCVVLDVETVASREVAEALVAGRTGAAN